MTELRATPAAPAADPGPALAVRDLVVSYVNGPTAVRGVDLTARAGTVTAVVGPNGAGKTTLLQAIAGRERRTALRLVRGSVRVGGVELFGAPTEKVARSGVALIPDRTKVFSDLTVDEHMRLAMRHIHRRERASLRTEVLDTFPRIQQWRDRKGAQLSGGERQLVAMAVALCRRPRVLLIDEMSQGLSPSAVLVVAEALTTLRGRDLAVVLVEQTAAVAHRVSDTVLGFARGELVSVEDMEEATHGRG
ncbi:ABC transporter ATP-binding protein [Dactylosporangium sp. CA-092794]|uniref:ABC transporter ATP-binding protein n=1 Tax=Dactylosporangium sp. CA-092794 TaxID=3239929 RepID=UPI003D904942